MKKILFLFLGFFLFNNFSYAKDLQDLGLEVNSFSQLEEKRTIFFKKSKFFNPEKDFNDKDINDKTINVNYTSNDPSIVYQFCCGSKSNASALFVSKLNDASNKLTNLSDQQVLELDNTSQPIKLAVFKKNKLDKFAHITDNNELILVSRKIMKGGGTEYLVSKKNIQKKYTIRTLEKDFFESAKFKQELADDGVIVFNKDTITLTSINTLVVLDAENDLAGVIEKKSGNTKIVLANSDLKKVLYYGIWDGQRNLDEANQFLKKPVLNIIPPVYSNLFKTGKTLLSERMPNYNFEDINNLVLKLENLNKELLLDVKNRDEKFNEIVKAKLEEQDQKKKAEELKAKQAQEEAEQKRLALERQEIEKREQARLETERKNRVAFEKELAAAKRMQYVKYGAFVIVAILALVAAIYFILFDTMVKILKKLQPQKKVSTFLKTAKKEIIKNKKGRTLGYWLADWANAYEDPKRAAFYLTGISISVTSLTWWLYDMTDKSEGSAPWTSAETWTFWILLLTSSVSGYYIFKIWSGIFTYHCPKCKRIFAGEIYKTQHTGSSQRTQKFKRKETVKNRRGDVVGTVESDEIGVVQTDTFHNWVKCLLCDYKWEYDTSSEERVR
jgi:phage FluMu protein Com